MTRNNTFLMYTDWLDMIEKLDTKGRSELFLAIMSYQTGKNIPEDMSIGARIAFAQIKGQFDKDASKYEDTCKKRKEASRNGGVKSGEVRAKNAKGNAKANESNASNVKQNESNPSSVLNTGQTENEWQAGTTVSVWSLEDIPEYSGNPYVELNANIPEFDSSDFTTESFERYSELDELGSCGTAFTNVGYDLMPTDDRGDISSIYPTGWVQNKYDNVDGGWLYNRCHLIAYQLTAENANEENLITGTRYFNIEGMLPFESMIADYVKETYNHVLYRVTPVFEGDNLLASGAQMEAESVEDNGEGIMFNIFCYNVQPGITIDYATGDNYEQ